MLLDNNGCQLSSPVRSWVDPAHFLQIACFFKLGAENTWGMPSICRFPGDPEQTQLLCQRRELCATARDSTRRWHGKKSCAQGHFPACGDTRPQTHALPGSCMFPTSSPLNTLKFRHSGGTIPTGILPLNAPVGTGRAGQGPQEPQLQRRSGPPTPS